MANTIGVLEVFGPTIQGEGHVAGQKTIFVRTYGCDYRCSWCDSKFTYDGSQKPEHLQPNEIVDRVLALSKDTGCKHITISGGNPAMYGSIMGDLVSMFHNANFTVAVETQGSIWQNWFYDVDDLTLSPKPPSSKMDTDYLELSKIIDRLQKAALPVNLKVVVFGDNDYEYFKYLHRHFPPSKNPEQTVRWFLQVGNEDVVEDGDISKRLLEDYEWLCDKVLADKDVADVRPLPQLHTLIWGNKRGV